MRIFGDTPPAQNPPVMVDLDGFLYEFTITDEMPVDAMGRTCLMRFDGAERVIQFHRSVTAAERAVWMAEAAGLDPAVITWRLAPLNEGVSRRVPVLAAVD